MARNNLTYDTILYIICLYSVIFDLCYLFIIVYCFSILCKRRLYVNPGNGVPTPGHATVTCNAPHLTLLITRDIYRVIHNASYMMRDT